MERYSYIKNKRIDLKKVHRTKVEWYEDEQIAILIVNYRKVATYKTIEKAYEKAVIIEENAIEYQKTEQKQEQKETK